jgi:hypothetical protein
VLRISYTAVETPRWKGFAAIHNEPANPLLFFHNLPTEDMPFEQLGAAWPWIA